MEDKEQKIKDLKHYFLKKFPSFFYFNRNWVNALSKFLDTVPEEEIYSAIDIMYQKRNPSYELLKKLLKKTP